MKVRVVVSPSCFMPSFIMEIDVPDDRDAEEYIDDLLDMIFSKTTATTVNGNLRPDR